MNTDLLIKLGVAVAIVAVAYILYAKFIRKDRYEDEAEEPLLDEDAEEDQVSVDDEGDEDAEEIVEAEPFDEDAETAEDVVAEGMMGDEDEEEEEDEGEEDEDEDDEVVEEEEEDEDEEGFTLAEGLPMAQDDTPVFTPPGM